jgi:hypothetical protein
MSQKDYQTLNMPVGQIAWVMHNGTDDDGKHYWQLYHRICGTAIWGTVIQADTKEAAVYELRDAIARGECEKVAEQAA